MHQTIAVAAENDAVSQSPTMNALRQPDSSDRHYVIGSLRFYSFRSFVENTTTDKKIKLTSKETALLDCLCRAGEQGKTRAEILVEAFHYKPNIQTRTVDSHMSRLRRKLDEASPGAASYIQTRSGSYAVIPD